MTPEVVKKLEEAFALGCTDLEACFYANISKHTLYNYQNANPEFIDRKESLKERPVLLARQSVIKALESDEPACKKIAFDYLTKRKRDEFADRVENTDPYQTGSSPIPKWPITHINITYYFTDYRRPISNERFTYIKMTLYPYQNSHSPIPTAEYIKVSQFFSNQ
jgi:hypothetical protein